MASSIPIRYNNFEVHQRHEEAHCTFYIELRLEYKTAVSFDLVWFSMAIPYLPDETNTVRTNNEKKIVVKANPICCKTTLSLAGPVKQHASDKSPWTTSVWENINKIIGYFREKMEKNITMEMGKVVCHMVKYSSFTISFLFWNCT